MVWLLLKLQKNSLVLDYGFSNATFEPLNHPFTLQLIWTFHPSKSIYVAMSFCDWFYN
jgi:hypothetical protein